MAKISLDVLIVSKMPFLRDSALEKELHQITRLLYNVESSQNYFLATEVIDLNRFRIIRKPNKVREALSKLVSKPFVFICNKN